MATATRSLVYLSELETAEMIVIGDSGVGTELSRRFSELQDLARERTERLSAALEAERAESEP